jgi:pimeloyl-ACP methyl ester carboxylesterase
LGTISCGAEFENIPARSPLGVGQALYQAIPESELVVLDGVGHISNVEAPDSFDAAVRRFLLSLY